MYTDQILGLDQNLGHRSAGRRRAQHLGLRTFAKWCVKAQDISFELILRWPSRVSQLDTARPCYPCAALFFVRCVLSRGVSCCLFVSGFDRRLFLPFDSEEKSLSALRAKRKLFRGAPCPTLWLDGACLFLPAIAPCFLASRRPLAACRKAATKFDSQSKAQQEDSTHTR